MTLVGTILKTSWGYDQTNVEFYEVVRESKSSVWIRRIASETRDGRVYPLKGQYQVERGLGTKSWNDTVYDEKTGTWVPNAEYQRDLARGYSEKICRKRTGYNDGLWIRIDDVRSASQYIGGGAYDTIAAGQPGH